jgi:hypothetical protein
MNESPVGDGGCPTPPDPQAAVIVMMDYSDSITGGANALSNVMDILEPLRTLFTSAGLKHAMHVPALCRTLG